MLTNKWIVSIVLNLKKNQSKGSHPFLLLLSMPCIRALLFAQCSLLKNQITAVLDKEREVQEQERGHRKNRLRKETRNKEGIYKNIKPLFAGQFTIFSNAFLHAFLLLSLMMIGNAAKVGIISSTLLKLYMHITHHITDKEPYIYRVDPANGLQIFQLQNPTQCL